jgi:4-diphosphocytidyl-2-C-methyl-D-erythritol kinase
MQNHLYVSSSRIETLPTGDLRIHAPAKLNLGLRVFPPRADGFHDLETWMVPLSWHDTLTISLEGSHQLRITGRAEGIPTELDKNLVGRAALKLAAAAGIEAQGTITLHKVLPPGGGLGGGSSDAANALVALNVAWNLHWPEERLLALAATLGSDIPFFIRSRPSLCTGRGEIMTDLVGHHPLFAVLLIPPQGCATEDVYAAFDQQIAASNHPPTAPATEWQSVARASAVKMLPLLRNDLEKPAFIVAPWLKTLRDRAQSLIGQPIHVTGSGSTLFTLTDSGAAANGLQQTLQLGLGDGISVIAARILT